MTSHRSEFVDFVKPLGAARLKLYDATRPPNDQPKNAAADPAKSVPQGFLDAMTVREEVFVNEQQIPLSNELDEDDARAFHWVVYASIPTKQSTAPARSDSVSAPSSTNFDRRTSTGTGTNTSTSTKIPIGTIRLVPPPHAPLSETRIKQSAEEELGKDGVAAKPSNIKYAEVTEPYLKLSRLAVIKEFRKAGISRLLIETALGYARDHPYDVTPALDPSKAEALRQEHHAGVEFKGLVLVHAQVGVQKVWRKYGFATDPSMGVWDEEGIEHVGMWKRIDVTSGRRASKVTLPTSLSLNM